MDDFLTYNWRNNAKHIEFHNPPFFRGTLYSWPYSPITNLLIHSNLKHLIERLSAILWTGLQPAMNDSEKASRNKNGEKADPVELT